MTPLQNSIPITTYFTPLTTKIYIPLTLPVDMLHYLALRLLGRLLVIGESRAELRDRERSARQTMISNVALHISYQKFFPMFLLLFLLLLLLLDLGIVGFVVRRCIRVISLPSFGKLSVNQFARRFT